VKSGDRFFVQGVICEYDGQRLPVANVSVGGLFVATEMQLLVGQVLELQLALQGREPFRVLARVSWFNDPASPKAPDLPQGFGIQITRIGLADKLAIVDVLKRTPPAAMRERRRESRDVNR
jgi:hypothetical protein